MTTADQIIAELKKRNIGLNKEADGQYRSNCPFRPGSDSNGFTITHAPDGEHGAWHDKVSDEGGSLYDLADRLNIPRPGNDKTYYEYHDAEGNLIFRVVRVAKPDGKKDFYQEKSDGNGGWLTGKGCMKGVKRPPYNLPKLAALKPGSLILIVEGEKDVETAKNMGFTATCNAGGAGKFRTIHPEFLPVFKGHNIVLIPDNDDAGDKHIWITAPILNGLAQSVKMLAPLGDSEGYDLTDWANDGGTHLDLMKLVKDAPEYKPTITQPPPPIIDTVLTPEGLRDAEPLKTLSADEILTTDWPEPIWAIPLLLPVGLTILAGKPKIGKSWLGLQIAKEVAKGGEVLGQLLDQPLSVLYLALEDTPRRLKQRMKQQHWPSGLTVDFITMTEFKDLMGSFLHGGADRLAQQIATKNYGLTIVDTLSRACFDDQNKNEVMSSLLAPVQDLANSENKAILLLDHHSSHMGGGVMDAVGNILGATQKGGALDTAWGLYRERGKQDANLAVLGRDVDELNLSLYFDKETGLWQYQGDYHALKLTAKRQEYLALINELDGSVQAPEVAKNLGITASAARQQLEELVTGGYLIRTVKGRFVFYELPVI